MRSNTRFCLKGNFPICFFVLVLTSFQTTAQNCLTSNIALGRPVVVNAVPEYAAYLTNGSLSGEWWTPDAGVKWAYVDLGQSYPLCKVVFKWGIWGTVPETVVQGSNDAVTWTNLGTHPAADHGLHSADNTYDYASIDVSSFATPYRYVRLYMANAFAWGPRFSELEVYARQSSSPPPIVSMTSPSNGASFTQGAGIVLSATASIQTGTITKVEFYQGSTKLGEDLSSPYSFSWNGAVAGDYTITAKAFDGTGQSATSAAITLHITAVPPATAASWLLTGNSGTETTAFIGTSDNKPLLFKTNGVERLRITADGRIGIKTDKFPLDDANVALAIGGNMQARRLKITQAAWADFVFDKKYRLPTLQEVEKYIHRHHRLPDLPSAEAVQKNGLDVGDSQALLLQKIEELTLYLIQINKQLEKLEQENIALKKQLKIKK